MAIAILLIVESKFAYFFFFFLSNAMELYIFSNWLASYNNELLSNNQ